MKKILLIVCFGIMSQLVGCSSNPQPESTVPVVESPAPGEPAVISPETPSVPVAPPTFRPQVQAPAPDLTKNAIASLAAQSRTQYQAKNYQAAIAIAERGLRIDRRAPELYLVLAQSYLQLANTQLAQQFVQQGIRYAQAGSDVAQKLVKIRDALPH